MNSTVGPSDGANADRPELPVPPAAGGLTRRAMLGRTAAGAVVAWTAPVIAVTPAAAQGSPAPDGIVVAVGEPDGSDNRAWTSTDNGATWTARTGPTAPALGVATDGAGNWVAVGLGDGFGNAAWTSNDNGATWTARTGPTGTAWAVATDRLLP
jgi:hypothetical protein